MHVRAQNLEPLRASARVYLPVIKDEGTKGNKKPALSSEVLIIL
jgi:hypothetical protein